MFITATYMYITQREGYYFAFLSEIIISCSAHALYIQFLMTGQPFPGQQQTIIVNQQQPGSSQQHQMFIPNQQLQFQPNQQQPLFLQNPQQPIIYVKTRQQVAQYHPQQPYIPSYSQRPGGNTALSSGKFLKYTPS